MKDGWPGRFARKLETGAWIDAGHVRFAATIMLVVLVAAPVCLFILPNSYQPAIPGTLLTDFLSFWIAAKEALGGAAAAVYDNEAFRAAHIEVTGSETFFAFFYPPMYLLLITPLGLLGFVPAFALFILVGTSALMTVLRGITGKWATAICLLAAPAVLNNVLHGQNAALMAALLGGALLMLERQRQVLAGILIGLMVTKPQYGLLLPFVLIGGGYWKAFAGAAVTACCFAGISFLVFGADVWTAFLAQVPFAGQTLESGLVDWGKMISVTSLVLILGGSAGLASTVQAIVTVVCVGTVFLVFRRSQDMAVRASVLVGAVLLATPFAMSYDLTLTLVALGFLLRDQARMLAYEKSLMAFVVILPAVTSGLAVHAGVPLAPLVPAILVLTGLRRAGLSAGGIFARKPAAA